MNSAVLTTQFAKPDRSCARAITDGAALVQEYDELIHVINAMPHLVAILDENRQIVGANQPLIDLLGEGVVDNVLGRRPGEAVACEHSTENPAGCGTSESCRECGAVLAILAAQNGEVSEKECRISQSTGDSLDLAIKTSPITLGGRYFTLFSAQDIAGQKRREVLERTFFHDIINSAGGLQGIADLLKDSGDPDEIAELTTMLASLSSELLDEIRAQRELLAAERWELQPKVEVFNSKSLMEELKYLYQRHPVGEGKKVHLDEGCADLDIRSAKALLFRVVGNMTKNALEASAPEGKVTLGCDRDGDHARFWVHNSTVMPQEVKLQVFNRSFSTKGSGRGIGTYSMKMLTERYLNGKVSFRSEEGEGTTFTSKVAIKP
jgi:K+-sensing histidine kinase KdpD